MRKMCYRYEELLHNVRNREACNQLTTLAQQICSQWIELSKQKTNPDISCQTSFIIPEPTTTDAGSDMTAADSEGFEGPNSLLEFDDIFVIESCFMHPGPSPVYSYASSSTEEDVPESSPTLEAFTFEGNVYAQPKVYSILIETGVLNENIAFTSSTSKKFMNNCFQLRCSRGSHGLLKKNLDFP